MRRVAKTDDNQRAIVAGLRAIGATVKPLHAVGGGVPDDQALRVIGAV